MKNRILQKITKNGLKYKNYLYFTKNYFFSFYIFKKYNSNSTQNYLKSLNFFKFFPFFTQKRWRIIFLIKKKREKEFLKWFDFFLKIQLFRQFILRFIFVLNELSLFYFYNIFTVVRKKIILKVFKRKRIISKKKSKYLGSLIC